MERDATLELFVRDNSLRYSNSTIYGYKLFLKQFFEFCTKPLPEINKKDIKKWLAHLSEKGSKPRTLHHKFFALKAFFNYCLEENIIPKLPTLGIETPKIDDTLPKCVDSLTIIKLKEIFKNKPKERAIFETLFCTGVRVSELINIQLVDIFWDKRQIWIRNGKGTVERFVLFTSDCAAMLKEYLKTRNDDNPYLFITPRGKPFSRQGLYQLFKRSSMKAELDQRVSPHMLRHTFASTLAEKGATYDEIAEFLGHKDINTTRIYSRLTTKARRKKYDEYR